MIEDIVGENVSSDLDIAVGNDEVNSAEGGNEGAIG